MFSLKLIIILNALVLASCQPQTLRIGQLAEVTWENFGKYSQFTLNSTKVGSNGWLGIGFGRGMNFISVIVCKNTPNIQTVEHYYNGYFNSKPLSNPGVGLSNISISYDNETLTCTFNRENRNQAMNYYQISETGSSLVNFVAAVGNVRASGEIAKHWQRDKTDTPARFSVDLVNLPSTSMPKSVSSFKVPDYSVNLPAVPLFQASPEDPEAFSNTLTPELITNVINLLNSQAVLNSQALDTIQTLSKPENVALISSFFNRSQNKINSKARFEIERFFNPQVLEALRPFLSQNAFTLTQQLLSPQNVVLFQNILSQEN